MKTCSVAVLAGDGIGPEIMQAALRVLPVIEQRNPIRFELMHGAFGASAWFETGQSWPEATRDMCDKADVILKGPIGLGPEDTKKIPVDEQPERGALLPMRRRYDTFANFRPVFLPRDLAHFSPLKPDIIGEGLDIMMVRELVGGLYFGDKEVGVNEQGLRYVRESLDYDESQIRRLAIAGFKSAMRRRKRLHSIHKSNVLKSSVLWTDVVNEVATDYPEVEVTHTLADAAATYLCLNPGQFDVMIMENLFGDILSDQGGGILGSLGLMPSACIGPEKSYYEPAHGAAPDIAGQNIANPYSMIGCIAMMLEMSCEQPCEARRLWRACHQVFADGYSTADLSRPGSDMQILGTDAFGERVVEAFSAEG